MADSFLNLDHVYLNDIGGSDYSASLPLQTLPKSKKGKTWKRNMMDRIEEIAVFQVSRNLSLRDYRKMYEGRLVYQDLEDTTSTTQAIAEFRMKQANLPTYIKHFDIIGIIVNQLAGEFDNQKDTIRVDSIDNFSQGEYFREKNALISNYVEEYFRMEIEKGLVLMGMNTEEQEFNSDEERQQYAQLVQQKQDKLVRPDQLEQNLSKDFKTVIAEWAELTLEADSIRFDMEDLDLEELVDYLLTGRYFRHYHIGYDLLKKIEVEPDSILISGPESKVDSIHSILLNKLYLEDVKESFSKEITIQKSSLNASINYDKEFVTVKGTVEKFTEGSFNVSFEVVNLPEKINLTMLTKTVEVVFVVALSDFNKIDENSFKIECDYQESEKNNLNYLIPRIVLKPYELKSVKVIPSKIDFLIQK